MRFLRNILIWILVIAVTAVALVGFLTHYPTNFPWANEMRQTGQVVLTELQRWVERVNVPNPAFLFWLTLLLLCALIILIHLFSRPKKLRIERRVEGGSVYMSPQATKRYIATALSPFADLVCRKITLAQGRRGLEATVYADLRTQDDVPALERQLIQRVHSALTDDLGIDNVSKVSVVIREFGLPKGKTPNPVPAVPVPGMEEEIEARPAAVPAPVEAPVAVPAAAVPVVVTTEPVIPPGQEAAAKPVEPAATDIVSVYAAPADTDRPVLNEDGKILLEKPADQTAEGEAEKEDKA